MQKTIITLLLFISLGARGDYWTQKASFPGAGRVGAVGFSIGNKGYVGLGCQWNSTITILYTDFWEYDPSINVWTQKADFIGPARRDAASFSVGLKGYVGTGYNDSIQSTLSDFYEYDPAFNIWTQKQNYPGIGKVGCTGFALGGYGFICMGQIAPISYSDVWQYDAMLNSWTQKSNYGGAIRYGASSFVIDSFAYVGIGATDIFFNNDFWKYNISNNFWTQIANFSGGFRTSSVGFSILQYGYIGTGASYTFNNSKDFWQYNPSANIWFQKTDFLGIERGWGIGFSIANKGYLGMGGQYINNSMNQFNDLWEYTPDSTTGTPEFSTTNFNFQISPNPAKDFITLNLNYPNYLNYSITISIADTKGKTVYTKQLTPQTSELRLPTSHLAKGMYTVRVDDGKQSAVKKFVKE